MSYSKIREVITNAKEVINNISVKLGEAIARYVFESVTVDETDIYNMVKDLPQDIQVQALCKALSEVNRRRSSAMPSYLQSGKNRRDLK